MCYSSSLECKTTCVALANRAMAKLKLKDYPGAEQDCTAALQLDATYVKAWLRRGAARRELALLAAAITDFEAALRLEPGNKAAAEDRCACVAAWMQAENVEVPDVVCVPITLAAAAAANLEENRETFLTEVSTTTISSSSTARKKGVAGDERRTGVHNRVQQKASAEEEMDVDGGGGDEERETRKEAVVASTTTKLEVAVGRGDVESSVKRAGVEEDRLPMNIPSETPSPPPQQTAAAAASIREQQTTLPSPSLNGAIVVEESINHLPIPLLQKGTGKQQPLPSSLQGNQVPKAPRTGVDFEKAWRGFKSDAALQSAYLRQIDAVQLPVLLKQTLTPGLLASLQKTALGWLSCEEDRDQGVAVLATLPQVPRFGMNMLSLSAGQKKELKAAWDAACGEHPELAVDLRLSSYSSLS